MLSQRSLGFPLWWVNAEYHSPHAETKWNDTFTYADHEKNDTALMLSQRSMAFSLCWVYAEYHSPYAEPTQNEVPLTLSHRRWETDDFVIITKDVVLQKISFEKSSRIHIRIEIAQYLLTQQILFYSYQQQYFPRSLNHSSQWSKYLSGR